MVDGHTIETDGHTIAGRRSFVTPGRFFCLSWCCQSNHYSRSSPNILVFPSNIFDKSTPVPWCGGAYLAWPSYIHSLLVQQAPYTAVFCPWRFCGPIRPLCYNAEQFPFGIDIKNFLLSSGQNFNSATA